MIKSAFFIILTMASVILAGCATEPVPTRQTFAAYPYRYDNFDFKVAWKTTSTPEGTRLEGVLQNVRFAQVEELRLTVLLLDARNNKLGEGTTFPVPLPLNIDEYRSFHLLLKNVTPKKGDLLTFGIRYRAVDVEKGSTTWLTTFTVDANTGVPQIKPEEQGTGL